MAVFPDRNGLELTGKVMTRSSHLLPNLPAGFCKSHTQSRNLVGAVTQQPKFDLITRRPRLRKPFAAILAKTEHVRGGLKRDKAEQPGPNHANGKHHFTHKSH